MLYAVLDCENFLMCTTDELDEGMVHTDDWRRLPPQQAAKAREDCNIWLRHPEEGYRFRADLMDHAEGLRLYMSERRAVHVVVRDDDAPQLVLSVHMTMQSDQLRCQAQHALGGNNAGRHEVGLVQSREAGLQGDRAGARRPLQGETCGEPERPRGSRAGVAAQWCLLVA